MNTFSIIYIISGLIVGIYTYGTLFAYLQRDSLSEWIRKEDYRTDMGFAFIFSVLLACAPMFFFLPMGLSGFNKHGWKLK